MHSLVGHPTIGNCPRWDPRAASSPNSYMPYRILIADDNLAFRRALRQLLERIPDWQVIEAQDGQEAVALASDTRPDVILLDLAMPIKDGLTAALEISNLAPEIPILMCTMHMAPYIELEAQRCGIRQVLSKTDSSLVIPAIRQLLTPQEPVTQSPEPIPIPIADSAPVSAPAPATPPEPDTKAAPSVPKSVA
jgi:DNA-binding NarL/FixJ family response regulator